MFPSRIVKDTAELFIIGRVTDLPVSPVGEGMKINP